MKVSAWVNYWTVLLKAAEKSELKYIKTQEATPLDSEVRVVDFVLRDFVRKFKEVEGPSAGGRLETVLRVINHKKVSIDACLKSYEG